MERTLAEAYANVRLYVCGIGDLAEKVPANSVDHIITDPPYSRAFLPVYSELAAFAAHALKPGGNLLVMVGQSYLHEVMERLDTGLRYQWTLAYLTPGGQAVQLWDRKVNTFWKPLLWYVKGSYEGAWVGDVTKSVVNDNDKRFHEWGQSETGIADILQRFTKPNEIICDPFVGGGTVGVVALSLGRRFIGADADAAVISVTRRRITAGQP